MTATYTEPPEALGPGTEGLAGEVTYGVPSPVVAVTEPRRNHAEIEREQAAVIMGCPYCDGIPRELLAAAGSGAGWGLPSALTSTDTSSLVAVPHSYPFTPQSAAWMPITRLLAVIQCCESGQMPRLGRRSLKRGHCPLRLCGGTA